MKKQNFHTGLDPVSRTKNSAQPTEFNAAVGTTDKVRFAQLFVLDSRFRGNDGAVVATVTAATVTGVTDTLRL